MIISKLAKIIVRVVSPIILIGLVLLKKVYKYKIFMMHTDRLGHLALNTQLFFIRHKKDLIEDLNYYLIAPSIKSPKVANKDLLLMHIEYSKNLSNVRIISSSALYFFFLYSRPLFNSKEFFSFLEFKSKGSEFSLAEETVSFNNKQKSIGNEILLKMGITKNAKLVSVYTRDSKFLENIDSQRNWSYHNYRDTNINSYLKAIKYLIQQGYTVIRIGSEYSKSLEFINNNYIEYNLSSHKSSFMDLYLPYISSFIFGCKSGASDLSLLFNTPILITDLTPIMEIALGKDDLFIQKKIVDLNGNIIPFKELIFDEKYYTYDGNKLESTYKMKYLENTEDEILDAAIEMHKKINGNLCLDTAQINLLKRYHNEFCIKNKWDDVAAPISISWLEKNHSLYL